VSGFKVVAIYCYKQQWLQDMLLWSRQNPGFNVPVHRSTMHHINTVPHSVTL